MTSKCTIWTSHRKLENFSNTVIIQSVNATTTMAVAKRNTSEAKKVKKYISIPPFVSLHLRYLHQDKGVPGKILVKRYRKYSRTAIYRHMKLKIDGMAADKRTFNNGRPPQLTHGTKRNLLREIPKVRAITAEKFTLKELRD